ncbi:MAG: FAD-dependent oxidoreductase [Hormoscilla sp. GUM202]|nr:FAD-dependent oxidoreductase [Hormoscilla sp. GUM202]
MKKLAIIGGGPGGLMAAYLLDRKSSYSLEITLFEASDRLGGKIISQQFKKVPLLFEAGVAELYDYSQNGFDPLRELIETLGLPVIPMSGKTIAFGDHFITTETDINRYLGETTRGAIDRFYDRIYSLISPTEFAKPKEPRNNDFIWAKRSFQSVLDEITDAKARHYFKVLSRSDLATEPHLTNGLYGLENIFISEPNYVRLYSIEGGIQRLAQVLAKEISAGVELNSPVVRIEKGDRDTYRVFYRRDRAIELQEFDGVIVALPIYWFPSIEWGEAQLNMAIQKHYEYYDRPAHYLRISMLFESRFWQDTIADSYFTSDAFGGCCIYDDSSRYNAGGYGVLSYLLAGNDALVLNNFQDSKLIEKALANLPKSFLSGQKQFLEGQVHRWVGTINALPGGRPIKSLEERHLPEPKNHPFLFVVGDYLFDSTMTGLMHSSNFVTTEILKQLGMRSSLTKEE